MKKSPEIQKTEERLKAFLLKCDVLKTSNIATEIGWTPSPMTLWLQGKGNIPLKYLKNLIKYLGEHKDELNELLGNEVIAATYSGKRMTVDIDGQKLTGIIE